MYRDKEEKAIASDHRNEDNEITSPQASQDVVHKDGGTTGWLQVAGSFALYFNHLWVDTTNRRHFLAC